MTLGTQYQERANAILAKHRAPIPPRIVTHTSQGVERYLKEVKAYEEADARYDRRLRRAQCEEEIFGLTREFKIALMEMYVPKLLRTPRIIEKIEKFSRESLMPNHGLIENGYGYVPYEDSYFDFAGLAALAAHTALEQKA